MNNNKETTLISQYAIIEHLKKSIDDSAHIEKFHKYLECWFFSDGEILYENEFVSELYSMLGSTTQE